VSESRALLPAQVARFAALARELAERTPDGFSARELRDASGSGRNLVIEVLEYFDARGFTRRFGEVRRIVGPAPL
jgi:selenocysteine-specific elongation factor